MKNFREYLALVIFVVLLIDLCSNTSAELNSRHCRETVNYFGAVSQYRVRRRKDRNITFTEKSFPQIF